MKRVTVFVFLVVASLLLSALVAPVGAGYLFQTDGTGTPSAGGNNQSSNNQVASADYIRLQALNNFQVQDPSGQGIGTVTDAVINLPKTRIDYLVMSGNNGRNILVPWSSLSTIDAQGQMFTFKDPASRLENAPTFDVDGIDFTNPEWSQTTRNYWLTGVGGFDSDQNQGGQNQSGTAQPTAEDTTGTAQPTGQAQSGSTQQGGSARSNQPGAVAVLASTLLNARVYDIADNSTFGRNDQTGSDQAEQSATAQPTAQADQNQAQDDADVTSGEALGTVAGALVTRINGDIRYILVSPEGALADQISDARANLNRDNQAIPQTGGDAQAVTPEATSTAVDATIVPESTPEVSGTAIEATSVPESTVEATGIPATGGDQVAAGDELIPVPFDIMFPTFVDGNLVLRASPFMLRSAPVLSSDVETLGFGWDQNVRAYWGSGGLEGGRFPFSIDNQLQAGTGVGVPVTGDQNLWAGQPFIQLGALQNLAIRDTSGNSIGNVTDFVVNLPKTRIDWIVMDQNGRSVLVPWAALAGLNEEAFTYRYDANGLQNAPDFDVDGIDFTNPDWDMDTINYWITGRNAIRQNNQSQGGGQSDNTAQATQQPTAEGTAIPPTGGTEQTDSNQAGTANLGSVAILASELIGANVYDASRINAQGDPIGGTQDNQGSDASVDQVATPVSPSDVQGTGTPQANDAQATSIPQTGSDNQGGTLQNTGGDVLGTVQGAIVNRLSGDIRYLLVAPAADLRNTGNQVTPQGTAQATGIPATGSDNQGSGAQATVVPTIEATVEPTVEATAPSVDSTPVQSTSIPATGGDQTTTDQGSAQAGSLIAVPFNSVLASAHDGEVVLRASAFMLRNAPVLNADNLPNTLGFGWDQGILNFWNTGNLNQSQIDNGDDNDDD